MYEDFIAIHWAHVIWLLMVVWHHSPPGGMWTGGYSVCLWLNSQSSSPHPLLLHCLSELMPPLSPSPWHRKKSQDSSFNTPPLHFTPLIIINHLLMTPGKKDIMMIIVSLLNVPKEARYHHHSDIINWEHIFFLKFKYGETDRNYYTQKTHFC